MFVVCRSNKETQQWFNRLRSILWPHQFLKWFKSPVPSIHIRFSSWFHGTGMCMHRRGGIHLQIGWNPIGNSTNIDKMSRCWIDNDYNTCWNEWPILRNVSEIHCQSRMVCPAYNHTRCHFRWTWSWCIKIEVIVPRPRHLRIGIRMPFPIRIWFNDWHKSTWLVWRTSIWEIDIISGNGHRKLQWPFCSCHRHIDCWHHLHWRHHHVEQHPISGTAQHSKTDTQDKELLIWICG